MRIFKKFFQFLKKNRLPNRLKCACRKTLSTTAFHEDDLLYRGFNENDLSHSNDFDIGKMWTPDFSCNWGKYSIPSDVRFRQNGNKDDGCYSITVKIARYNGMATPVHDPICCPDCLPKEENYSHVEIRALKTNQNVYDVPRKKGKINSHSKKLEYRRFIKNNLKIEIPIPTP